MGNCCKVQENQGVYDVKDSLLYAAEDRKFAIDNKHDADNGIPVLARKCRTGDLVFLYETDNSEPNFGVLIRPDKTKPSTPLLMAKARCGDSAEYTLVLTAAYYELAYGEYSSIKYRLLDRNIAVEGYDKAKELALSLSSNDSLSLFVQFYEGLILTKEIPRRRRGVGSIRGRSFRRQTSSIDDKKPFPDCLQLSLPHVISKHEEADGPLVTHRVPFYYGLTVKDNSKKKHVLLDDIIPELGTGDIVLMSGVTQGGAIIRLFDHAEFSHVAMIVKDPYMDRACLWEAAGNSGKQIDIDTGHVIHGVSLIPFDAKVLTGWCKPVAIRKLKGLSESEREELSQIVLGLRDHYRGVPYEENTMELIKATIDIFDDHIGLFRNEGGEEALKSIFCSELVAMAYQRLKLIPNDPAFNEYTPEDFASSRSLSLLRGHLEEEIYITFLQEEQD